MTGKCPDCKGRLTVSEYVETVICKWCHAWFHPEQLQEVESSAIRPGPE